MAQMPPGSSRLTTHQLSNPCRKTKLIWSRLDQKLLPESIIQPTKSHGPRVGEGWSPKGKSGYCHQRRQKSHLLWTVRMCMTVQDPDVSVTGTTRSCITFSVPQTLAIWREGYQSPQRYFLFSCPCWCPEVLASTLSIPAGRQGDSVQAHYLWAD